MGWLVVRDLIYVIIMSFLALYGRAAAINGPVVTFAGGGNGPVWTSYASLFYFFELVSWIEML